MSTASDTLMQLFVNYLTLFIDIGAGLIIGISAVRALVSFFAIQNQSIKDRAIRKETIRIGLASGLLLGLDFVVGADVLRSILVPSPSELLVLGAVVGIRVVLSWSLMRETDKHDAALVYRGEKPIAGRKIPPSGE